MTSRTTAGRITLGACSKYSSAHMLKIWHRAAGMLAASFLLILTVTGLLLMQTDDLDLDSRYVSDARLLDWYGIRPAPPPLSFSANERWITQQGTRLYYDAAFLSNIRGRLIGAIPAGDELLVATTEMLVLLTGDGRVAEKLDATSGVPAGLTHIGTGTDGAIIVRSSVGSFRFDPISGRIEPDDSARPAHWSAAAPLPATLRDNINRGYRGQGLSLERVILDLHTGRLFGKVGVALFTLASVLLLLLIFSGIVLWTYRAGHSGSNDRGT
ncbi:MAG TPA: PepSY domain-containing protein [Gammaproteobacteria bacterium]|nr:PepSY domain-containing protein [Gammaproteobacteria bacterium]